MAIHDLKAQIARLPEQPGVYLYFNEAGETIYVGKARSLRDRVRSYLGAYGMSPRTDALLDEAVRLEVHRHRLGRRGAGAREQSDQDAEPSLQHPAARRQELPVPAADDGRGVPARAGGPARRTRRHFYAGPFLPARFARRTMALTHRLFGIRSCNEIITGQARTPVPRVRHQALHRAVRGDDLHEGRVPGRGRRRTAVPRGADRGARRDAARPDGGSRGRRALRARGAAARRDAHRRDADASGIRRWRRPISARATCSA